MEPEVQSLIEFDFGRFKYQYNPDLEMITSEMLEFLKENNVKEEWLLAIITDLNHCETD